MLSTKEIKKTIRESNEYIFAVNEFFNSIQGEGRYVGQPATFIRFNGCSVQCSFCDTKYTWESIHTNAYYTIEDILFQLKKMNAWKRIILTGGEPAEQLHLTKLIKALIEEKYIVQVETSGAFSFIDDDMKDLALRNKLIVVLSPKHLPVHKSFLDVVISDLKLIINEKSSVDVLLNNLEKYNFLYRVSFQPEYTDDPIKFKNNCDAALRLLDYSNNVSYPVAISMQIHKILNID